MAKTKKGKITVRSRKQKEPEGDHIRQLAPIPAVKTYIKECIASKNATSEEGQRLSTATKRATDQGVNVPAARIAARLYSKANQDPMKGRVLWEDVTYYLIECTDFDEIAPTGMFTAEEAGQKRPKQPVLKVPEPTPEEQDAAKLVRLIHH
jgi:hypothetical protein